MQSILSAGNRLINQRQYDRTNSLLLNKIINIKYANISSLIKNNKNQNRNHSQNKNIIPKKIKKVKVIFQSDDVKQQNHFMYERLINQKSTISTKNLANQRLKNIQLLKRISKYPFQRMHSVILEPLTTDQIKVQQKSLQKTKEKQNKFYTEPNDKQDKKHGTVYVENKLKDQPIILFSNMIKLQNKIFQMILIRHKDHYQISLQIKNEQILYTVKLPQLIGTKMLSQNDYDYQQIAEKFIKFSNRYIYISFLLQKSKKLYSFKFQKINNDLMPLTSNQKTPKNKQQISAKINFFPLDDYQICSQIKNKRNISKIKTKIKQKLQSIQQSKISLNCQNLEQ